MKRSQEKELMDLAGQPKTLLEEDLGNLSMLNRFLGGSRAAIRGLSRAAQRQGGSEFSLLDLGTGSADIPAAIVDWARRRGIAMSIVALDTNPITVQTALTRTRGIPEVSIVRADAMRPPFPARSFDFVLASQLLHHFSAETIVGALRAWSELARKAIIISDLIRHPIAYHAVRCLTRLFTRNIMTLTDAPLSVKRAFTATEWRELFTAAGIGRFELISVFPFRLVGVFRLDDEHDRR
ncbi:MAG TPA: methyltransferase domain-containing protein [Candidatus Eisenbacteria bacterium]|nr:methyltransferase domain-containing protein [Candidatus Eisenbacteria bacterium]